MHLDIKIPMGWFFLIIGIIISIYGQWIADPAIYELHSNGYNVNFYWGIVLAVFGGGCLYLSSAKRS